jgi:S1-C subfamily serine protease
MNHRFSIGLVSFMLCFLQPIIDPVSFVARAETDSIVDLSRLRRLAVKIVVRDLDEGAYVPMGSGVIVQNNGKHYVVTAKHVVKLNRKYQVQISNGLERETKRLGSPYLHPQLDIALLEFEEPIQRSYASPPLGYATTLVENDTVYAVGYPAGSDSMLSKISQLLITNHLDQPASFPTLTYRSEPDTQENAPQQGMSGGPVLNQQGELIGIHAGAFENIPEQYGMPIEAILERIGIAANPQRPEQSRDSRGDTTLVDSDPSNQIDQDMKVPVPGSW